MHDDRELLRQFVEDRAEAAFAELVRRHLGRVYAVALRQVAGDAHLAQDVAQLVFISLARKAPALLECRVLGGWLHSCAVNAAANTIRTERRRRAREQEVHAMQETSTSGDPAAREISAQPVIDDGLQRLKPAERDALVLRFFENRPFAEIGAILQLNENTARMRVERALDRLRVQLERRGIRSTAAALGAALATHAAAAAPAGLAANITGTALAGATTGGIFAGAWTALSALHGAQAAALAGLVVVGAGFVGFQLQEQSGLRAEIAALRALPPQAAPSANALATMPTATPNPAQKISVAKAPRPLSPAEATRIRDELDTMRVRLLRARTTEERLTQIPRAPGTTVPVSRANPPPKLIRAKSPVYPFELNRASIPGEVVVDFVVDESGAVIMAAAAEATHPRFADMALAAVRQWQFEPGRLDGVPRNVNVRQVVRFDPRGIPNWF